MDGRLRGWTALPWPDRGRMLVMMLVGLPAIAIALRLFGYVNTRGWLERRVPNRVARTATRGDLANAERLAQLASVAGRHGPIAATCLRQSLLVYWLLRRKGLAPELKLGVRRQDVALEAHAWVELEGVALDASEISHQPFGSH